MNTLLNIADGQMNHDIDLLLQKKLPFDNALICGIRIGSETCSRMLEFIDANDMALLIEKIKVRGYKAYVVFPDICQHQWDYARKLLDICYEKKADRIVVNDYGMLFEANERFRNKVILGRMFDRRMRDPRCGTSWKEGLKKEESNLGSQEYRQLYKREQLCGIEMECFGSMDSIPSSWKVYVHIPYLLLTHGRICEFGGIQKSQESRYRLDSCHHQCQIVKSTGTAAFMKGVWYQRQNALYTTIKRETLSHLLEQYHFLTPIFTHWQDD